GPGDQICIDGEPQELSVDEILSIGRPPELSGDENLFNGESSILNVDQNLSIEECLILIDDEILSNGESPGLIEEEILFNAGSWSRPAGGIRFLGSGPECRQGPFRPAAGAGHRARNVDVGGRRFRAPRAGPRVRGA